MADTYLNDPNNPEFADISRQRKLAELLTLQAFNQPQGAMVSGQYVKPSFTQQLAPLVSGIAGQAMGKQLDEKQLALAEAIRGKKAEVQQQIMAKLESGDNKGALAIASQYPEFGGKDFIAPLLGNVIPKAAEPTVLEREFKAAKSDEINPFKGSFNDFKNQMNEAQRLQAGIDEKRLGLEGQRVGLEGARFGLENQRFGLENQKFGLEQQKFAQEYANGKPLTETQGNATAFGMRMKESNQLLNDLEKKGVKDTGVVRSAIAGTVGMTPFIGQNLSQGVNSAMNMLPSALGGPSSEQQQVDAARKNFITAVLRKESGAAISPTEFVTEAQKYFPQPGDTTETINQKRNARETAIRAMEIQAGPGKRQIEQFNPSKGNGQVKFLGFE